MISDFVRIFDRDIESFKNYENKKEIVEVLFEANKNLDEVIKIIREDIEDDEGNIFNNLLSLYPFSIEIVSEFLRRGFVDKKFLLNRLDILFDSVAKFNTLLVDLKRVVRDDGFSFSKVEERLKELDEELKKYEEKVKQKDILKEKLNKLNALKTETQDVEEIEKNLKKLQNADAMMKKLNRKINESKKIFKTLCKDEG